ncbi:MAG: hypothetical protein NWS56_11655, partial [Haliea sp.]|nr:hypothetical protein [Haliea sp.]
MTKAMACRLFALWLCCQALVVSATSVYGDNAAARALVNELVEERGLDRDWLLQVMAQAERQERILEAMSRPA